MASSDSGPSMNRDSFRDESFSIQNTRVGVPQPDDSTIPQNSRKRTFLQTKVETCNGGKDFAAERNYIRWKQIRVRQETHLRYVKEYHEHQMALLKLQKEIEELEWKYWEKKSQE